MNRNRLEDFVHEPCNNYCIVRKQKK